MEQSAPIILASGSPRRQALLKELGIDFKVVLREIDEHFPEQLKREEVALFLAKKKASVYKQEIDAGNFVITADTIVCADDKILNKPAGFDEAINMLQLLSGRSHEVITAVCITGPKPTNSTTQQPNNPSTQQPNNPSTQICFHVSTTVVFKQLSPAEIKYYVETHKPFDKAGGYGIQEWIGLIGMERMEGSYYNVVGLPVKELYDQLIALNIVTGL